MDQGTVWVFKECTVLQRHCGEEEEEWVCMEKTVGRNNMECCPLLWSKWIMGFKGGVSRKEQMPQRAALSLTFHTDGFRTLCEPEGKSTCTHTLTSLASHYRRTMTMSAYCIILLKHSGLFPFRLLWVKHGGVSLFPHVGMSQLKQANQHQFDNNHVRLPSLSF